VLMHGVPPIIGSLGLAAVFSAEISAADAGLFMLTTSLSQDLSKRFLDPSATDARLLAVARGAAIACGAAAVAIAIASPTIIGVIGLFYALLGVSLFVPILAGLYSRRAGTTEALAAIGAGVSSMLAVHLTTEGRGAARRRRRRARRERRGGAPSGGRHRHARARRRARHPRRRRGAIGARRPRARARRARHPRLHAEHQRAQADPGVRGGRVRSR